LRQQGAFLLVGETLKVILSGSPDFSADLWRHASGDEQYWKDICSRLNLGYLDKEKPYNFLSKHAAAAQECQTDQNYVDFLWMLFDKLFSKQQQSIVECWLNSKPDFLKGFAEKLRERSSANPFGHWRATANYRRLASTVTSGLPSVL
jgi:hypothetical protein